MSATARVRIHLASLALATAVLASATPASAQEWKIHLLGKPQPVTASFYAEETPWIFYKDDDSQYLFAVGCNRVEKVERAGAALPPPACPVERLPTSMPTIYTRIMDLEAKRLDDSIQRLREQTRAYAQAIVGTFAATGGAGEERVPGQREILRQRSLDAIAFLQSQISDTLFDIRLTEQRVGTLHDAAQTFPRGPRQRFFFFTK